MTTGGAVGPFGWSERTRARLLVATQFCLLAVHGLLRRRHDWPTPHWLRSGALVAELAGAAFAGSAAAVLRAGLTPSPLPNERAELRVSGPFALVRHPIYSGLLIAASARTAASGDRRQLLVLAALSTLLHYKAGVEEAALAERFPDYPDYAARTPRLVPIPLPRSGWIKAS